jgi:hypothetical protein
MAKRAGQEKVRRSMAEDGKSWRAATKAEVRNPNVGQFCTLAAG